LNSLPLASANGSWNGNVIEILYSMPLASRSINGTAMKFEILFIAVGFSQRMFCFKLPDIIQIIKFKYSNL
jgi:hypothetical protein